MVRSIAIAWTAAWPALAAAQASAPPPRVVPAAPPAYVSALADYQRWREPSLAPWKQVNDEVGRLGGHAGHLRTGQAPPANPPSPAAPGAKR